MESIKENTATSAGDVSSVGAPLGAAKRLKKKFRLKGIKDDPTLKKDVPRQYPSNEPAMEKKDSKEEFAGYTFIKEDPAYDKAFGMKKEKDEPEEKEKDSDEETSDECEECEDVENKELNDLKDLATNVSEQLKNIKKCIAELEDHLIKFHNRK